MKKIHYFSVCCLFILGGFLHAAEQEFFDVTEEEVFEEDYEGYKTTLNEQYRGGFNDRERNYQDVRQYDQDKSSGFLFDFGDSRASYANPLADYQDQYRQLFQQSDFGANNFKSMTQGFQSEFNSLFTREDSLIKDFSVPQPRYYNQGYTNSQRSSSNSGANKRVASGNNASASSAGSDVNSDAEQPALISWVFSIIAYVREHPFISGFIALFILSLFSLVQVIIQRYTRPFG